MRRILQFSVLGLAVGVLAGCEPDHVIPTETPPTAGVRFVHAVPDTGAMDFRFVDRVENSAHYNMAFRNATNLYYKGTHAGQRHLRIFMTGNTAAVATTIVKDTVVNLVEGTRYTFVLWGYARPGSAPAMRLSVIEDGADDPGAQVALRVLNTSDVAIDVRQYPNNGAPPAAPTWANIAPLSPSSYLTVAAGSIRYNVREAGGDAALFTDPLAPAGDAGAIDLEPIPGTTVPGSAVSLIVYSRSVVGSQAPQNLTSMGGVFVWDRRPPRTCSLC